jgi:NAD(P)-dependent dehydrogenase (short-subunit alcohol dehydrogenase family)
MPGRLAGKIAIVTGAASGIGLAIVEAFLREGARVALLDRSAPALAEASRHLTGPVSIHPCDVSIADEVDPALAAAVERQGAPDILVNNAGIAISGGLEEMSEADWDRTFDVNVKAIHLVSRRIIPLMRARGGGSIINIASESAFIGFAMHPAYCASKAAVVHLGRSMAARYAPDRIRVNALCPGTIDTPLYRHFLAQQPDPDAVQRQIEAMHPLGIGSPQDIAHAAVFLASDESRYATGAPFLIDGGSTAI